MIIKKILNNNVVVTMDPKGIETVVMGSGLAFQRKVGERVDPSKIEKTFTLSNPEITNKFQQILADIPMEHMLISEKIIDYAKKRGEKLNDTIYITLPDHISAAIERYKKGITLKNPLMWDIRRLYRDEFEVGEKAAEIVREAAGVSFLEDEKAFIAMHFVNAQLNESNYEMNKIYTITHIIQEILDLVSAYFHIRYDQNSLTYFRFVTHLKFFAQRLLSEPEDEEGDGDQELLAMIMEKNGDAFQCAQKIKRFLSYKYHYSIGNEEMTYLTIHIARIIKKTT